MYDVIVVGARCAGAVAALLFARSGYSVLVLDKSQQGSDTLSTHILVTGAMRQLEGLGFREDLLATGAPPVHTWLIEFDGGAYPTPVMGDPGFVLSVRRTVLDPLLVRAAMKAGASFQFGVRVDALIWHDGRVTGVRGMRDKEPFEAHARLVIGADGRHSIVARKAAAPEYNIVPSFGAGIYAYFRGIGPSTAGSDVIQFASGPGCDILCAPCDGDLHIVLLIVDPEEFKHLKGGEEYEKRLRTVPTLAPRLVAATRASRLFRGSERELRGYFRNPYGPGWALAGDAGYYAHPAAAGGINDALRSAELLHAYVHQAWDQGLAAETFLEQFQAVRDSENEEAFYESYRLGSVNPFRDPVLAAEFRGET